MHTNEVVPIIELSNVVLVWLKALQMVHLFLEKLLPKHFSVCATSVSSERVFSTSGNIVTPHQINLNPEKMEMLTFLSKNL